MSRLIAPRRLNFVCKKTSRLSSGRSQSKFLNAALAIFIAGVGFSGGKKIQNSELILAKAAIQNRKPAVKAVVVPAVDLAQVFEKNKIKGLEKLQRESGTGNFSLILSSDAFFESGTAKFGSKSEPVLHEIVTLLKSAQANAKIEIEGHTDDSPVVKQRNLYRSNWELSVARAASVVHVFEEAGFSKEALKVVGYGDSRPLLSDHAAAGNRRIVLRISTQGSESKSL